MIHQVAGVTYSNYLGTQKQIKTKIKAQNSNWFSDWLNDKDKKSTDGKDDGHISTGETIKSIAEGTFGGIIKDVINHPISTGITLAVGIGISVATGGAALPILTAIGASVGAVQIGYGAYKPHQSHKDGDTKRAYETMGNGIFALVTSAMSAKSAVKAAQEAGMETTEAIENKNAISSLGECFKDIPNALKTSWHNLHTNFKSFISPNLITNGITSKPPFSIKGAILSESKRATRFGKITQKRALPAKRTQLVMVSESPQYQHNKKYSN